LRRRGSFVVGFARGRWRVLRLNDGRGFLTRRTIEGRGGPRICVKATRKNNRADRCTFAHDCHGGRRPTIHGFIQPGTGRRGWWPSGHHDGEGWCNAPGRLDNCWSSPNETKLETPRIVCRFDRLSIRHMPGRYSGISLHARSTARRHIRNPVAAPQITSVALRGARSSSVIKSPGHGARGDGHTLALGRRRDVAHALFSQTSK
jgi:hypothetical protein